MLVLTRKPEESIILGGNIEIKVLGIEDGKVKIGIKAPRDVDIYRKEVYLEIQEENKKAAGYSADTDALKNMMKTK
ncbi:carbon storage regulator CsrA [Anoxynatronum buryatiense]|uniref:Translational regulator CsrA n=1 Tax=Anoxynatronum buryatiense TaxID=489973 RepID=A0AA46AIT7_9CLOT|nr:carbon storage regulator CsrA [Anoxynatronum buryatiense]SMP52503.1 carbon storage regulator, CsrA [Anoxynatronum buryatiense]